MTDTQILWLAASGLAVIWTVYVVYMINVFKPFRRDL